MYKDIGGYDMKYDDFREMCRKTWSEKINHLCNDFTKNKNGGKYRVFNESKNTYFDYNCQTEAFQFFACSF